MFRYFSIFRIFIQEIIIYISALPYFGYPQTGLKVPFYGIKGTR